MQAKSAALMIMEVCKNRFPKDSMGMEHYQLDSMASCFNIVNSGTHKYIPTEQLNADLGIPNGAGVFAYYKFKDGSYILMTCNHGLCVWDGSTNPAEHLKRD
jgi:hypothetical protein